MIPIDTDTDRVNRTIDLLAELGQLQRAEQANGERATHETGDYQLAAYCYGMAEAYRLAAKLINRALQPDYPIDAL